MTACIPRGTHKEDPLKTAKWQNPNQVQSPVLTVSLHTIRGRPREGGEAKAEFASWYVGIFFTLLIIINLSYSIGLTIVEIDKPKKK